MRLRKIIFLLLLCPALFAQKSIKKANKLIGERKYRSAWEVLEKADPLNKKPAIAIAKSSLLTSYFIHTVMHQVFTLKDLQEKESLEELRAKDENGILIHFDPEAVLDSLLKSNPKDYALYKALGDYYYEVFTHFQENWLKKPGELVGLIEENYLKSSPQGTSDYIVQYRIGFAELFLTRFRDAQKSLTKAIALNTKFPDSYYSLAYTYLQLDAPDSALPFASKARELFTDTFNRSDAGLLLGMIYSSRNDTVNALKEYKAAADLNPGNQSISKMLLSAELKYNGTDLTKVASAYFDVAPKDPETYGDLINGYFEVNRPNEIISLLNAKLVQFENDNEVIGNIYFYRAYIYLVLEEKDKSKADLVKAREFFLKVFPPSHEIFNAIDDAEKELSK
jgi:tetratricopeptide (TPR) repeat protein